MLTIRESDKLVHLSESGMLPNNYKKSIDEFLEHNLQEGHLEERTKEDTQTKISFDKQTRKLQNAIAEKCNKLFYTFYNVDDEVIGQIVTNCPAKKLEVLWIKYYNNTFEEGDVIPNIKNWEQNLGTDVFAQFLNQLGYFAVNFEHKSISA